MSENNGIVPSGNIRETWEVMLQQAEKLVKSGLLPKELTRPEQVVAILMLGRELGLEAWQSINGIDCIAGRPTLKPATMLALIYRFPQTEVVEIDAHDDHCTVTMKRKGMKAHTATFSLLDASKITTKENNETKKLSEKYNWRSMPKVMCMWRAVAQCARAVFPDVIQGLYTPDELGADVGYTETGESFAISTPPPSDKKLHYEQIESLGLNHDEVETHASSAPKANGNTPPTSSKGSITVLPKQLNPLIKEGKDMKLRGNSGDMAKLILAHINSGDFSADASIEAVREVLFAKPKPANLPPPLAPIPLRKSSHEHGYIVDAIFFKNGKTHLAVAGETNRGTDVPIRFLPTDYDRLELAGHRIPKNAQEHRFNPPIEVSVKETKAGSMVWVLDYIEQLELPIVPPLPPNPVNPNFDDSQKDFTFLEEGLIS